MATGVVDAARWGSPAVNKAISLHEVSKYYILPSSIPAPNNHFTVYPNPVQSKLHLQFNTEKELAVKFEIINALGQVVKLLPTRKYASGENNLAFDLNELQSGLYLIKATSNDFEQSLKFIKN